MPWSASDAKKHKKGLTPAQASKWAKIANNALRSCQARGGKDCEASAIRIANSKFNWEESGWDWLQIQHHDEHFGISIEERERLEKKPAGGSNAGKYKTKGPFCGPSGGAPKGTYPVNTRARAIAAISYARHAPNPSGIKACVCRHWASLPACKKKSKQCEGVMNEQKIPKGALRFVDQGCHAHIEMAEIDGKQVPRLKMVAYSGGIIKGHWYWDNLAIDLDGIKFSGNKFPVLEQHDVNRKIAVIGKPVIEDGKLMAPENAKFMPTEEAEEFIKLSQAGFPYQSSIYAKPTSVERIAEDAKATVNGMTMKGPGTIWRQSEFKEMSVCVFGWDSKTRASAFSKEEYEDASFEEHEVLAAEADCPDCGDGGTNPKLKRREVKKVMDEKELREQHPELVVLIERSAVEKALSEANARHDAEKEQLSEKVESLKESNKALSDKVLALEKNDAIRAENEIKAQAQAIWTQKFGDSAIPEHLWGKVSMHVSHTKYVKEGVFDKEAFSEAVDAEIKDWEGKGVTSSVLGTGFSEKEPEGENKKLAQEAETVQADVDRLVKLAQSTTSNDRSG